MATTTPNFGWSVPTSSDLVKNGATAIETLGDSIDASLVDLKGGTTGQVLAKASNTDMDFVWAADAGAPTSLGYAAGKTKITNGGMQIAQRGTSFSVPSGGGNRIYGADRWFMEDYFWTAGSNLTLSNDSTVYPDGFSRSLKLATGATGLTLGAGGVIFLNQFIEGSNIASMYKSSSITVSFYVRSSVTGTYSVLLTNGAWTTGTATRALVKEYTVNAANTWERKSIVVDLASGTSSGTWNTSTSIGLQLQFNLGANANRVGNAYLNNWANFSAVEVQSTSSVQWSSNANATFYLTGVQIEEGSVATAFQTATGTIQGELAACQRYYFRSTSNLNYVPMGWGKAESTTTIDFLIKLPQTMRVVPTAIDYSNLEAADYGVASTSITPTLSASQSGTDVILILGVGSGFTQHRMYAMRTGNASNYYLGITAEL